MFSFTNEDNASALDKTISEIFSGLNDLEPDDPRYSARADQIVKLMKLQKDVMPSWMPSPDAILSVAGTIVTAILVLNYEKIGVVTSKAFTFIGKMK